MFARGVRPKPVRPASARASAQPAAWKTALGLLIFCTVGVGVVAFGGATASAPAAVMAGQGTPVHILAVTTKQVGDVRPHTECVGFADTGSVATYTLSGGCSPGVYYQWPSGDASAWKRSAGTVGNIVFGFVLIALGLWLAIWMPRYILKNRAVAQRRARTL